MTKQNQIAERIAGMAAIMFALFLLLIPFLNLGSIPAFIIGIYLLTRKRKQIG